MPPHSEPARPARRIATLLAMLGLLTSAAGSILGPPSPSPQTLPGDQARQSVREVTGPATWDVELGGNVDGVMTRGPMMFWKYQQGWQPNVEVVIANDGDTPVRNPRVIVNDQRDWLTLQGLVAEATRGCTTEAERARGIWEFVRTRVFNAYPSSDEARQAWRMFGCYGFGFCSEMTPVLGELWQAAGLESRMAVWKPYHTAPEVRYDGEWHYLDASFKAILLDWDGQAASAARAVVDPALVRRSMAQGLARSTEQDAVRRQFYAAVFVPPVGVAHWPQAPADAPDWELLPGASMAWRWSHVGKHYSVYKNAFPEQSDPNLFANGEFLYEPDLGTAAGRLGIVNASNLAPPQGRGLAPARGGQPLAATWKLALPWPLVGGRIEAEPARPGGGLKISRDGANFTALPAAGAGLSASLDGWLSPGTSQAADRTLWVRVESAGEITRLRLRLDVQLNLLALPELELGPNRVEYRDDSSGARRVTIAQRWVERTAWTPPAAPQTLAPVGGNAAGGTGLTFTWRPPASPDGLARYQFELYDRADLKWTLSPSFERFSDEPRWQLPEAGMLQPDTVYYWRVRAQSAKGVWGPWSEAANFRVVQPARPFDLRLAPVGESYHLQWRAGEGGSRPVRYRLYGSIERGFTLHDEPYAALLGGGAVSSEAEYKQVTAQADPWRTETWPGNFVTTVDGSDVSVVGPDAVAGGNTFHWRVVAEDANGNRSAPSECLGLPQPVIASAPPATLGAGQALDYAPVLVTSRGRLTTIGPGMWAFWDAMHPTWSLPAGPAGLSIEPGTGRLTGRPSNGRHRITIEAKVVWLEADQERWPNLPRHEAVVRQTFELQVGR